MQKRKKKESVRYNTAIQYSQKGPKVSHDRIFPDLNDWDKRKFFISEIPFVLNARPFG